VNLNAVAKIVPAGIVPAVAPPFWMLYLTTSVATGKNDGTSKVVPVADPSELIEPITMSPSATPDKANVPVVVCAALYCGAVAAVNAAVP
jgi:hypothetical protein